MQLHQLQSSGYRKRGQRVGRGGKRGTTAGRGTKGQKSRSGRKLRPASRDLIQRIPKRRGFKNPAAEKPLILNLSGLTPAKGAQGKLTVLKLKEMNLIPRRHTGLVKILGTGEITFPVVTSGLKVSKSAEEKIVKAGGRVEK